MTLRKKHVRRGVVVLLLAAVLGPLAALALYGYRLRGGAYGEAVAAELESSLRCSASVRGVRPTGPSEAAADAVELAWTTDQGRLVLRLEDLKAESNAYGWYVRAARGRLALDGPSPAAVLAALNQRLVQVEGKSRLMSLVVNRLDLRLDLGHRVLRTDVAAAALSNMTAYIIDLFPPRPGRTAAREPMEEMAAPLATLRLDPASRAGVFEALHVEARGIVLGRGGSGPAAGDRSDTDIHALMDLAADWSAVPPPRPATVRLALHDLDLAPWTKAMPGGPVTGKGALTVDYSRPPQGPAELDVSLESAGGRLTPASLQWLAGLPAGLARAKLAGAAPVAFDRLALGCRVVGGRGQFDGPADPAYGIPLVTCRLLGRSAPLLAASGQPFDARDLWPPLARALGLDGPATSP